MTNAKFKVKMIKTWNNLNVLLVRAANIVRAGENLIRLISDIKTFLVIHDFPAINATIEKRGDELIASVSYLIQIHLLSPTDF